MDEGMDNDPNLTRDQSVFAAGLRNFLASLGIDAKREGMRETPARVIKAFQFWTSGYKADAKTILKVFADGHESYDEMITVGNIPVYSLCEHHLTPFFGVAHVAYIPNGSGIVGLSKLARIVDMYARRVQVQERLTREIADAVESNLNPIGVGVVIRCRHLCMESRGVQKPGTITYTSALRGAIKEKPDARAEFLKFVDRCDQQGGKI